MGQNTKKRIPSTLKLFNNRSIRAVLILLLMAVGIRADDNFGLKRVVLMTEEFRNFRRLMMTIPDGNALIPQVRSDPETGEFEITVTPVEVKRYTSRKVIRKQGQYPLSIQISFPNSTTIHVMGNTTPYQTLVSYHILEEDLFIFDIYKQVPLESVFRERTVGISRSDYVEPANHAPIGAVKTTPEFTSNLFQTNSLQARFWKAIVFALIPFSVLLILFWVRKTMRPTPRPKATPVAEHTEPTPPIESVQVEGNELSPTELKELTQKVMDEKGVSYDEATLLLNMSGTSGERKL